MNPLQRQLVRLDGKVGQLTAMPDKPMFIEWRGNPWTPEQMTAAIRQNPAQRVFWRSLLATEVGGRKTEDGGQRTEDGGQKTEGGRRRAEGGNNIVTLDYAPHAAQMAIHRARDKRFRMVCTGRRFGKTLCLAAELLDRGGCEKGGDYGWVAPTYNVAERGIEAFRMFGYGFVQESGRAPCRVEFQGRHGLQRTRIWFLSADNPDSMRGFGFQGVVIDEAAMMPADVWNYVLRPTISQTLGWAMLVSTPVGRNWFYDLFTRGNDPAETDYQSFTFPSNASPFFPAQDWEDARKRHAEHAFRQEYMAEFLEDGAGVFKGIDACLILETGNSTQGTPRNVVIGCDVAKHTDWTVLIAMDAETGRCFAMDRFNQLDWPIQKERIVNFARRYGGRVIMDATGIGDPIYDDLRRVLPDIEPFKLTMGSKVDLIQELVLAIAERQVSWPGAANRSQKTEVRSQNGKFLATDGVDFRGLEAGNWEILTNELKRYEYETAPQGGFRYGAPSGFHDDCVIALALANHRKKKGESCGCMFPIKSRLFEGRIRRLRGDDGGVWW